MLPSGISVPSDSANLHPTQLAGVSTHVQRSTASGTPSAPAARGPLARQAMRLLGVGVDGQTYRGAVESHIARTFGGGDHASTVAAAWMAARALPTPLGHARLQLTRPSVLRPRSPATQPGEQHAATEDGLRRFSAAVDASRPLRRRPR